MYVRLLLGLLCVLGCATLADASPFAYVANYYGNSVTRIDLSQTSNNTMVIPVPDSIGPYGVAVNDFGSRVYVSGSDGYVVSVIDTSGNTVSSITLPFKPGALAVNSAGTRLYVADPDHDSLAVVNAVTGTLNTTVTVGTTPSMESPAGVAVYGNRIYVSSSPATEPRAGKKDAVHIFETTISSTGADTVTHLGTVDVDLLPMGLALNPAGTRLYVACSQANKVNAIDLSVQPPTVTVIPADGSGVSINKPIGVAVTGDGLKAYVTLAGEDTVAVINTQTNTINTQRIAVGDNPMGIAITPDGTRMAVANSLSDDVYVINPATNAIVGTPIGVGEGNSSPQSLGKFAGPELIQVNFPYPFNGTVTPVDPISLDENYVALVPKGYNLPLNVQADTNFVVNYIKDGTTVLNPPYVLPNVVSVRDIYASFTRVARTVILVKAGDGAGRVYASIPVSPALDCGTTCQGTSQAYTIPTTVNLKAEAAPGSTFAGWMGAACSGQGDCSFTAVAADTLETDLDGNFQVTAKFDPSLITSLQDAYTSAPNNGSITCDAAYTAEPAASFKAGLAKTVTLVPAAGNTTLTAPAFFTVQYGQIIIGGTTGGAFIIK